MLEHKAIITRTLKCRECVQQQNREERGKNQ